MKFKTTKAKKLLNLILSSYLRTLTCGRHRSVRILFLLVTTPSLSEIAYEKIIQIGLFMHLWWKNHAIWVYAYRTISRHLWLTVGTQINISAFKASILSFLLWVRLIVFFKGIAFQYYYISWYTTRIQLCQIFLLFVMCSRENTIYLMPRDNIRHSEHDTNK